MLVAVVVVGVVLAMLAAITLDALKENARQPFIERGWRAFRKGRMIIYEELEGCGWKVLRLPARFVGTGHHTGYIAVDISCVDVSLRPKVAERLKCEVPAVRIEEGLNQPPQRNAGSRPSSGDSSASDISSSLGPRG